MVLSRARSRQIKARASAVRCLKKRDLSHDGRCSRSPPVLSVAGYTDPAGPMLN
jgi:hypothetical protein